MTKNVAVKVFMGVVLMLLAVLPATVMAQEGDEGMAGEEMMAAVSCQQDYTVQADDWLSRIADKFYGDILAFPAIVEATNAHHDAGMVAGDESMMVEGDEAMMAEDEEAMMAEGDEAMMAEDDEAMMAEGDEAMMAEDEEAMMAEGDEAMMAEDEEAMMAEGDEAMMAKNDEAMMAGGYALIENADLIEPGWILCIPSPEDAQKLLAEAAMMAP